MTGLEVLISIIGPLIVAVILYVARLTTSRLDKLEEKSEDYITKQELREYVVDMISPIKENVDDIKDKVNKLYDRLLK